MLAVGAGGSAGVGVAGGAFVSGVGAIAFVEAGAETSGVATEVGATFVALFGVAGLMLGDEFVAGELEGGAALEVKL